MTRMLDQGRTLFGVLAVGLAFLLIATIPDLPEVVASQYDGGGAPNRWSSRAFYGVFMLAMGVLLPLAMVGFVGLLTRNGPAHINIPSRDYWRRPENAAEAVSRARACMWWVGCLMAGICIAVHALILDAHRYDPPRLSTTGIVSVLAAIGIMTVVLLVAWYRLFQPARER